MTEQPNQRADPWNRLWRVAVSDGLLIVALSGLIVCLALLLLVPQRPPTEGAVGPWRAQMATRFGAALEPMDTLGLFSLGRSPIFRVTLSILGFSLLMRAIERSEALSNRKRVQERDREWQALTDESLETIRQRLTRKGYRLRELDVEGVIQADRWPVAEAFSLLAHIGPLLVLLGLLIGSVWGWQVDNITAQAGERTEIPGHGTITLPEPVPETWTDDSGVRLYQTGAGPEVMFRAIGADGEPLGLLQRPDEQPVSEIQVRLVDTQSVPYFAIPEAEWLVRIAPQPGAILASDTPLIVQVLRLRTGDLVAETVVNGETVLTHEVIDLHIRRSPYPILSAVHDPGYWPKLIGLCLAAVSLMSWAIWPARRLWVREDGDDNLAMAGDLPAILVEESDRAKSIPVLRLVVGGLSLCAIGWTAWNLAQDGVIWQGAPLQLGLVGAWVVAMVIYFIARIINDRRSTTGRNSTREGVER
jgi:hypothetical protein